MSQLEDFEKRVANIKYRLAYKSHLLTMQEIIDLERQLAFIEATIRDVAREDALIRAREE